MMVALYLLLDFAMLAGLALVSPARGWRLAVALLVLGWTAGSFNAMVEAVAFQVLPIGTAAAILAGMLVQFALLAALAVLIAWKWRGASPPAARANITPLRLLAVILGYELLYFGAGALVFPFVQHFYTAQMLPSFGLVAGLQVPRALIFAAAAWPWLRTNPRHAPLMLGLAFAVIAGIAPLLPENPYMPADIRFAHAIETSSSNFLFGFLVGWLLRPRRTTRSD